MRFHRIHLICILAFAILCSGCGTVRNLASPDRKPYGGVTYIWEHGLDSSGPGLGLIVAASVIVDISLSSVGDTLTYPLTRWLIANRAKENAKQEMDFK